MTLLSRFDSEPRKLLSMRQLLRIAACGFGLMIAGASVAQAQEDDADDKNFEQRIIDKIMKGMGATTLDNSGIEYRERSPLVIPPSTNLPPPEDASKSANVANWPKDPDVTKRRNAVREAKRNPKRAFQDSDAYPISQSELNKNRPTGEVATSAPRDSSMPGGDPNSSSPLSPAQLGYKGGMFSNLFSKATGQEDTAKFEGEPTRNSLVQPPPGYQTPSSNYAYGLSGKSTEPQKTARQKRIEEGSPD